jgi:hypothetical protein
MTGASLTELLVFIFVFIFAFVFVLQFGGTGGALGCYVEGDLLEDYFVLFSLLCYVRVSLLMYLDIYCFDTVVSVQTCNV